MEPNNIGEEDEEEFGSFEHLQMVEVEAEGGGVDDKKTNLVNLTIS